MCLSLSARGFLAREPPARKTLWPSTQCALALGRRCTIAFLIVTHPEMCFQKYYFSYPCPLDLFSNYYLPELPLLRLYCAPHTTYVADVFVSGTDFRIRCKWHPTGRKTRFATRSNDNCVSGKLIAIFWIVNGTPCCGGAFQNTHVLLHVRTLGDSPVPWR